MIEVRKSHTGHVFITTDAEITPGHQVFINDMPYAERDVLIAAQLIVSGMKNKHLIAFKGILEQESHDDYSHEAVLLKAINEEERERDSL